MRVQDIDETIRSNMVKTLARFVFPVYCTTSVEDYEYFFVGSGFFLKWNERCVFVTTKHQFDCVGENENIFVPYGDELKGISVRTGKINIYPDSDLAIYEVDDPTDLIESEDFMVMPLATLKSPSSLEDYQVFCVGYPRKLSAVDYLTKLISPKIFGFFCDSFVIHPGRQPIEIALSDVVGYVDQANISNREEATQGLSGSPIFATRINDDGKTGEIAMLGVATHVSSNPNALRGTRAIEVIDCLQNGFGLFDKQKEEDREYPDFLNAE